MASDIEAIAKSVNKAALSAEGKAALDTVLDMFSEEQYCVATRELGGNILTRLVRPTCADAERCIMITFASCTSRERTHGVIAKNDIYSAYIR